MPTYPFYLPAAGAGASTSTTTATEDHAVWGLARLIRQYRDEQPRYQGALVAYLSSIQDVEDVTQAVADGRWPADAIGVQLDTLGRIVGQERGGLSDDQYRLIILGRIMANRSNGRVEDLYAILLALGYTDMIAREHYPAALVVESCDQPMSDVVNTLLSGAKAGGCRLDFVYSAVARANTFQASGLYNAPEYDATQGAGYLYTPSVGGQAAGSFTS